MRWTKSSIFRAGNYFRPSSPTGQWVKTRKRRTLGGVPMGKGPGRGGKVGPPMGHGAAPGVGGGRGLDLASFGLVLHGTAVGLGGRGIGLDSGLFGVQALPHVVQSLHLGLAAAGIVVDGPVVGELALRVDDEHVRRGPGAVSVAGGP